MNQGRKNEVRARNLVEHVTSLSFEHSDKSGGVDYLSRDGAAALEVTRFTDEKKEGRTGGLPQEIQEFFAYFEKVTVMLDINGSGGANTNKKLNARCSLGCRLSRYK